ncbi:conserved hypothetical protein [Methylocella tundrae]|uniref:Uncharacterized protein n=1 Tax=Methylocella tundrae TaxID=227605 RepID=A0A8B6M2R9_METTU|nr:hypothetical protein [Methylocella tundrae]VTZ26723.1 conserved hypothetical protein [Methylocella tundrae]VTZ49045.1 conserved hypothetical protein [Methylocella tundrae]
MPDAYVIQISGRTAGIVARDGRDVSFNFFAASHLFNAMEGQSFADPLAAERAARYLAKHGSLPRRGDHHPPEAGTIEA